MNAQEKKQRVIRKLLLKSDLDPDEKLYELFKYVPYRHICKQLIIWDHESGKYSYGQIANRYDISKDQVVYIIKREFLQR